MILLGDLREWNDTLIQRLNPGVRLPQLPIKVLYRRDATGETALLTNYLAHVSVGWQQRVGSAIPVVWPTGRAAENDLGVVAQVLRTPGAIGYVDWATAHAHQMTVVALVNHAGVAVAPGPASLAAAAQAASAQQLDVVDVPRPMAYPLSGVMMIVLCSQQAQRTGPTVIDIARYIVKQGVNLLGRQNVVPLPAAMEESSMAALQNVLIRPASNPG